MPDATKVSYRIALHRFGKPHVLADAEKSYRSNGLSMQINYNIQRLIVDNGLG